MNKYISFDIGGTKIKYAIMNQNGEILLQSKVDTPQENQESFFTCLYDILDKYENDIVGIAMCIPGKIDTKNKIIHYGGALHYLDNANLQTMIVNKYHLPLEIENDGKAAALCELWLGKMKDYKSGAVITLGTGVGGGIIIDGNVLHGKDFQAGELSWMLTNSGIGVKNAKAYSGEICSAVKMIVHVNEAIHNTNLKDGKAAFKAIEAEDERAIDIFEEFCMNVAIMILNVQAVIDGEIIIIGGGISSQSKVISEIKNQFNKIMKNNPMLGNQVTPPKIVAATYENDTNLYGALYALLKK